MQHATGDFVITIDDDLQNPPEELIHLIRKADEGCDVVFGEFHQKMHGFVRAIGTRIVGWLNVKLFKKPPDLVLTNVRCVRREIVDAMCDFRTSRPYIQGMLLMTAKTFANVPVRHEPRAEGRSGYTLKVIAKLVWRIIFNYSAFPLRALTIFGAAMALVSFLLGAFYFIRALVVPTETRGWPSMIVLLSFY
jgi:glycosyltransferase involved in cell wall biosynthesis